MNRENFRTMFDILYKLSRKALPASLYFWLSDGPLGRGRSYKRRETYKGILNHYLGLGVEFKNREVMELGSGCQSVTALGLLEAGASHVHLVEPKLRSKPPLGAEDLTGVSVWDDIEASSAKTQGKIGCILSHLVMEHVEDPKAVMASAWKLLSPGGTFYALVDLSDHTYHLLTKFAWLRNFANSRYLFHLRYSDRMFRWLNDPKCSMNRRLLPEYRLWAKEQGWDILSIDRHTSTFPKIHADRLTNVSDAKEEDLALTAFGFLIRKPGRN
jgi:SAM-dependent methyltransferase